MNFEPLDIDGALGICGTVNHDFRGSFVRTWDIDSAMSAFKIKQASFTLNPKAGTLRGLHYQREPFAENKLVYSPSGKIFDVILDLRESSPTFEKHLSFEVGPNCKYIGLYIPAGCAHGYLTLEPNSALVYYMDKEYSKKHSSGVLWNDPRYGIPWPSSPLHISEADLNWEATKGP
jgi:dTDP-4-dehydrorhamnose 3,5-epimerase